ncbi:hypothetical protein BP6252_03357 [Coleophoma cylindrospora]|uniref:GET complex subunit GET2 n=1 Tax=Coleophoma cylindrospora TaxID=1849047 RepID=A0A3D8S7F9_9HELO|nr:hypothetical protein BP6252_03357 [Coleophoma cylindrospora]
MAETPPVMSSEPSTPPSSASEQARIRKERREAKIKAGGSARLDRITGLGGGVKRDPPPQPTASTADPEEVDISQHYYEPKQRSIRSDNAASPPQQFNDDQLRQLMLGFDPATATPPPGANPFAGFPGLGGGGMPGMEGPGAEDPMMKMLQQMMGGVPGEGANGMPAFPGMTPQPVAGGSPYAYLWRVVHAVFALSLGLYIAVTTTFSGTKLDRERSAIASEFSQVHFFWIFATAEVLLQSSRYFVERGKSVPMAGVVGMVVGFLPQPWKGYVELVGRYSRIWTTVSGDAFVCVFVLGVCAWARGAA